MTEPLTMTAEREAILRRHPHWLESTLLPEVDALRVALAAAEATHLHLMGALLIQAGSFEKAKSLVPEGFTGLPGDRAALRGLLERAVRETRLDHRGIEDDATIVDRVLAEGGAQ